MVTLADAFTVWVLLVAAGVTWLAAMKWHQVLDARDHQAHSVDTLVRPNAHDVAVIELGLPRMPGDRRRSALEIDQRDVLAGDLVAVSGLGWHGRPLTHRAHQAGPDERWLPTDTVWLIERGGGGVFDRTN